MIRFTGFASRFYFYPENFAIPEEQNKDYFGELKRQVQYSVVQPLYFTFHSIYSGCKGAPFVQPEEWRRLLPAQNRKRWQIRSVHEVSPWKRELGCGTL